MNLDKLTSFLGLLIGGGTATATAQSFPAFSKMWWVGMVTALGIAAFGYLTNKTTWPKG